jgi:hypothetical protein
MFVSHMSDNYVLDIWNIRLYLDVYINIWHQGTINMTPYASDEISKTNPHKVILWFQQNVILYSQRNVIIQRWPLYSIYCNGSYAGLSTGLFTWKLLCWSKSQSFLNRLEPNLCGLFPYIWRSSYLKCEHFWGHV